MRTFLLPKTRVLMSLASLGVLSMLPGAQKLDRVRPSQVASAVNPKTTTRVIELTRPDTLGLYKATHANICDGENIVLSPSGRYLVAYTGVWKKTTAVQNGGQLVIGDVDCLRRRSGDQAGCFIVAQAFDGLRPISWNEGSKSLFVIEQDTNLVQIELNLGSSNSPAFVKGRVSIPRAIASTVASIDTTNSPNATQEASRLRLAWTRVQSARMNRETTLAMYLHGGAKPIGVFEEDGSLNTSVAFGLERADTGLAGPSLMHATLAYGGAGNPEIYGIGLSSGVIGQPSVTLQPFERATLDSSGKPVAIWSPKSWRWVEGSRPRKHVNIVPRNVDEIIGFAATDGGDLASLTSTMTGKLRLDGSRHGAP